MRAKVVSGLPSGAVSPFAMPLMEGPVVSDSGVLASANMPTAADLEALHQQAYDEGFESGRQDGLAAMAQRAGRFDEFVEQLARPFAELDAAVVSSIADLAILIARHVIRRELKIDPGEVVGVVRETMQHLPVASGNPLVRLHPDDVELVREALSIGEESKSWRLQADPLMTRGGCVVETETSRVDASVEARLAAIASKMLGGEREGDREEGHREE